jgi:hypothetical protein
LLLSAHKAADTDLPILLLESIFTSEQLFIFIIVFIIVIFKFLFILHKLVVILLLLFVIEF